MDKERAANIITNALRTKIHNFSYSEMAIGKAHTSISNPKYNNYIKAFKDVSKNNLKSLASLIYQQGGALKQQ
jgi:uncharacterized sporulation protein YeaH/YhbH (DUF444 family)